MTVPAFNPPRLRGRRVLIVGADGMLARAWRQWLDRHEIAFDALGRSDLDVTNPAAVEACLRDDHGLVINCSAYTNVDGAESDEAAAMKINADAVGLLGRRCAVIDALLVHYSTDYVFNGQSDRPWRVDDPIDPLGAYGRTKAAGEKLLRESNAAHLLIRVSWLYAPWGKNFVRTIARVADEKSELRVVNDQIGRPTSAEHLADATARLLAAGAEGTWHITDGGQCSWFEFAREIVRLRNTACRVDPCSTAEFPRPAPRPAYSVLDLAATEAAIGPMPDWKSNLADVISRLE